MRKLTVEEEMELKLSLNKAISNWLSKETEKDNDIGWLPDDVVATMTDSAFNVLKATNSLTHYLYKEDLLK